jgi:hypothetical protein
VNNHVACFFEANSHSRTLRKINGTACLGTAQANHPAVNIEINVHTECSALFFIFKLVNSGTATFRIQEGGRVTLL